MHIHISDSDIEDLNRRLKQTQWPPPIAGSNWDDGTNMEYLRNLVSYWSI